MNKWTKPRTKDWVYISLMQAVADFLAQICNYVGPNLEPICLEFLTEYTDDIIDALVNKYLQPQQVCASIGACPWSSNKLEKIIVDYLVKKNICIQLIMKIFLFAIVYNLNLNMEETNKKVSEKWEEFILNSEREKENAKKEIEDVLAEFGKGDQKGDQETNSTLKFQKISFFSYLVL